EARGQLERLAVEELELLLDAQAERTARSVVDVHGGPGLAGALQDGLEAGLVGEVRPEPALGLRHGTALARGIRGDLVAVDPADGEVARLRVMQVDAGHGRRGRDGERLGEREAVRLGAEQLEELRLLRVVRAGRVAEGRPDAAVALGDQLLVRAARALLVPGAA